MLRWDYVNTEKVLYCFYKMIFKTRTNLKRHNRVYIPSSKRTYRPMGTLVVAQLFYKKKQYMMPKVTLGAKFDNAC